MINISKKNIIILVFIESVVLVALIFLLVFGLKGFFGQSNYWAVYLKTGDLYFGKLVRLSHYTLRDPYLLVLDSNKNGEAKIQKFEDAFWGPEPEMKINPENVVWISRLSSQSSVVKYMEGKANISQRSNSAVIPENNSSSSATGSLPAVK